MTLRQINPFWLPQPRQWRPLPPGWQEEFFAALQQVGTVYGAAKKVGVPRGSVYYQRDHNPEFAERLDAILAAKWASSREPAPKPSGRDLDAWANMNEEERIAAEIEHYGRVWPKVESSSIDGTLLAGRGGKTSRKAKS